MATSLKKLLGSSAARPIGSHVWFPNVDNPSVNPIYQTDNATYLRSGYVLTDDPEYQEATDLFGTKTNTAETWVKVLSYDGIENIAYGNGRWIAVYHLNYTGTASDKTGYFTSTDGVNWSELILFPSIMWGCESIYVFYSNDEWVVVTSAVSGSTDVYITRSSDGETWSTPVNIGATVEFNVPTETSTVYAKDGYIVLGSSMAVAMLTSDNGVTWETFDKDGTFTQYGGSDLTYYDGTWVFLSGTGALYSTDRLNWTLYDLSQLIDSGESFMYIGPIVHLDNKWMFTYSTDTSPTDIKCVVSDDLAVWSAKSFTGISNLTSLVLPDTDFNSGIYLAGALDANYVAYTLKSVNLSDWEVVAEYNLLDDTGLFLKEAYYGNHIFVSLGHATEDEGIYVSLPTPLLGLSNEETQGDAIKYMRIK